MLSCHVACSIILSEKSRSIIYGSIFYGLESKKSILGSTLYKEATHESKEACSTFLKSKEESK